MEDIKAPAPNATKHPAKSTASYICSSLFSIEKIFKTSAKMIAFRGSTDPAIKAKKHPTGKYMLVSKWPSHNCTMHYVRIIGDQIILNRGKWLMWAVCDFLKNGDDLLQYRMCSSLVQCHTTQNIATKLVENFIKTVANRVSNAFENRTQGRTIKPDVWGVQTANEKRRHIYGKQKFRPMCCYWRHQLVENNALFAMQCTQTY